MKYLSKQFAALRAEKLSQGEHEDMRVLLMKRMETYSARHAHRRNIFRLGGVAVHYKRAVGFMIFVLLAVSTGASYAAASALPGDILYPIKIHVNERIEGTFAVDSKAHAEFAQKQIRRRVIEAETLISENRFDDAKRDQLAEETKTHVDSYTDARLQVEHKGNRGDVEELEDNMESTIRDHERAFNDMGVVVVVATSTDNTKGVRTLLRGHRAQEDESFRRPFVHDEVKDESLSEVSLPPSTNKEGRGDSSHVRRSDNDLPAKIKDSVSHLEGGDKGNIEGESSLLERKDVEEKMKTNAEE